MRTIIRNDSEKFGTVVSTCPSSLNQITIRWMQRISNEQVTRWWKLTYFTRLKRHFYLRIVKTFEITRNCSLLNKKNGEWIQKITKHMLTIVMHSQRNPIKFQRTPKHSRIWNHSQIWNLVILIKRVFNVVRAQNCQKNEFLVKKSIFSVKNHSFFKKWGFQFATEQMLISCYNIHRLIQPSYTQKCEKKNFWFFFV